MTRVPRKIGLQGRVVALFLVVSLVPLAVSAVLVGQIARVAHEFSRNQVAEFLPHLVEAQEAYRQLVAEKKATYEHVTKRVAVELAEEAVSHDKLLRKLKSHEDLVRLEIPETNLAASRGAELEPGITVEARGGDSLRLVATFRTSPSLIQRLHALDDVVRVSQRVDAASSVLPRSYRRSFLVLVGGVVVLVTALGLFLGRRFILRIRRLVAGTRGVAGGDLSTRVRVTGNDELTELTSAFNTMVADLQNERGKTQYLQRMSAWQDVARRLAHEIKNPLTPIQLAMQQCVSAYRGGDERFGKTLSDCDEIVKEEVANLRRLVDAFRDLGRLPRVELAPVSLRSIVDDLIRTPEICDFLRVGDDPDIVISADKLLLRRLLSNLVENGIAAGQENGRAGRVDLTWHRNDDQVFLVIEDEGTGVAADLRDRIFDPYVTSRETGTGLGLAISMKIAMEHGGNLRLSSENSAAGGARFEVVLPLPTALPRTYVQLPAIP